MNEWAILGGVSAAVVAAVYFFFIRVKTDPRVRDLADLAYQAAAKIAGVQTRGSTPPVNLKAGPWEIRGVTVVGNYRWTGFFGKVLWDSILVIRDPARIWGVLVHEMTHAIRRRNGKPSSEAAADAAKILSNGMAGPDVAALLAKL